MLRYFLVQHSRDSRYRSRFICIFLLCCLDEITNCLVTNPYGGQTAKLTFLNIAITKAEGSDRVDFQGRGVLLIWILVGQGLTALAAGADGVIWAFCFLCLLSMSLEGGQYRLKYCLKGPSNPKQPTIRIGSGKLVKASPQ